MRKLKAHKILQQIIDLQNELTLHQSKCKHKNATRTPGGSTGNYDPMEDRYWVSFNCPTCLKRWTVY